MFLPFLIFAFHAVLAATHHENNFFYIEDDALFHFERFMETFNKTYNNEVEKELRFKIFKDNLVETNDWNRRSTYSMYAVNQFYDMTLEEFLMGYTGLGSESESTGSCKVINSLSFTAPPTLDWRQSINIPIKNQNTCRSCWAFAATGNVEAQYAIRYRSSISLSEQQMVDCDSGSDGCIGGYPAQALSYLIQVGGQEPDDVYPYVNQQQMCQFTPGKARVRVTDCISFGFSNEEMIKEALTKYGPLTAAVDATSFQKYHGGVIVDCMYQKLNHAVMLVGYGTDAVTGRDYWIIKNSWGSTWGENGFARIERGVNACGIVNNNIATAVIA